MREVKFRVWIEDIKMYINNKKLILKFENGRVVSIGSTIDMLVGFPSNYTLEQYIGLVDCKGNDIYENDEIAPLKAQIVWSDKFGCWCGRHQGQEDLIPLFMFADMKDIEVVGNIHEQ